MKALRPVRNHLRSAQRVYAASLVHPRNRHSMVALRSITWALMAMLPGTSLYSQQPKLIDQGTTVSYDRQNYVVFEDVGRITSKTGATGIERIRLGRFVRLHVHRGDEVFDFDVVDPSFDVRDVRHRVVESNITQIKYVDKDNLWVISTRGSMSAALIDLKARKIVRQFRGWHFSMSPDATKVAFEMPYDRDRQTAVFVNETMVYPSTAANCSWKRGGEPRLPDGIAFDSFLRDGGKSSGRLQGIIVWRSSSEIQFTLKEDTNTTGAKRLTTYAISGLSTKSLDLNIDDVRVQQKSSVTVHDQ